MSCALCRLPFHWGSTAFCPSCFKLLVTQRAIENGRINGVQIDRPRPYVTFGRRCPLCRIEKRTCNCDICKKPHGECTCSAAMILEHYGIFGADPPVSERNPTVSDADSFSSIAVLAKASGFG